MIIATEFAQFANQAYPNRRENNPSKKTPSWITGMAAGGLTEFVRSKAQWRMWAHDDTIGENLQYAQGVQDTQQYRRYSNSGDGLSANSIEVTNRDGYLDEQGVMQRSPRGGSGGSDDPTGLDSIIKAPPLPILPVKLRGLKSTIMQQGYEATITALGQKAKEEALEHEADMRLWMNHGDEYREIGQTPPPGLPDPMPATEPELQTYLDDWQVAAAAALERKVKICGIESGIDQLMSECGDDLLNHGYGCLIDFQLPGKRPIGKRIPVNRGLFLPSAFPDYRDQSQGGYLETLNLDDLLAEAVDMKLTCNAEGKPWTKDDIESLRQLANKSLPDTLRINEGLGAIENTGAITVARWFFRTNDLRMWKEYEDEQGNKRVRPIKDPNYKLTGKGKLLEYPKNCVYEATLIAGTNLSYNCRAMDIHSRDLHNPSKARLPFSIYAMSVNGQPVSVVRNAKGIVDEIERSWRGYMAVKRTYTPAGSNIPPDLLTLMKDAMKFKDEDAAYNFIKRTGDSFFPRNDADHPNQPVVSPITTNPFGIPEAAVQHLDDMFRQLQLLEMVTGANSAVSAASPTGELGKGVTQLALQGAANVMEGTRNALKGMYESHVRNIAARIWLTEHETPVTGSVPLRSGKALPVGPVKDMYQYEFYMQVALGPTPEEIKNLRDTAFQATQGGPAAQITYADYFTCLNLLDGNLKTAQRYLAMAVSKKRREDSEEASRLQQENGDIQSKVAQQAAVAQQETDAKAHELRMIEAEFNRATSWGGIDRQVAAQKSLADGNNQTKIQTAIISEEGSTERDLTKQAAEHRHDHEAAVRDAILTPSAQS